MQLDGGVRFEVPLDRYLLVECGAGDHVLTVILKGEVEMQHRWHHPLIAKLSLIGYEAEAAAALPENRKKTIELIGDSITEGVLVDAGYAPDRNDDVQNRPYQDDVTATYAYRTALALGHRGEALHPGDDDCLAHAGQGVLGVQHRSCCRGQLLRNALCQQAAALHVLLCFLCFLQLHSDFSTSLGHSAAQTHFYKL